MNRVNSVDRHSDALERGIGDLLSNLNDLERRVAAAEKALTAAEKISKPRAKKQKR